MNEIKTEVTGYKCGASKFSVGRQIGGNAVRFIQIIISAKNFFTFVSYPRWLLKFNLLENTYKVATSQYQPFDCFFNFLSSFFDNFFFVVVSGTKIFN